MAVIFLTHKTSTDVRVIADFIISICVSLKSPVEVATKSVKVNSVVTLTSDPRSEFTTPEGGSAGVAKRVLLLVQGQKRCQGDIRVRREQR